MAISVLTLSVQVPCIQGNFGKKLLTFQTNVQPTSIPKLLGHDPRSAQWNRLAEDLANIYRHIQRKTDKPRRTGTYRYIEQRMSDRSPTIGAFPAVSIGCTKPLEFKPYSQTGHPQIHPAVGELQFDLSVDNTRILLDGLSRLTAALEMADSGTEGRALVDRLTFPLTIFAPSEHTGELTVEDLGQLFHDFNFLAEPVKKAQAIDLDQSDPYITLTNQLAKQPVIRDNGGVEARAASLGKKSTALVVKPVLLRFVQVACEGGDVRRALRSSPTEKPQLTESTFDDILNRLSDFLSRIAHGMGAQFKERSSVHLLTPVWYAWGKIFHELEFNLSDRVSQSEKDKVVDRIAALDWSRTNEDWNPVLHARGGLQGGEYVLNYLSAKSGLDELKARSKGEEQQSSPAAVLEN